MSRVNRPERVRRFKSSSWVTRRERRTPRHPNSAQEGDGAGEAHERGFQVTAVHTSFGRQRSERCASTLRVVGRDEAEVCSRSEGSFVERRIGADPDAA